MECKMLNVLSKQTMCQESPAGISNYAVFIPTENIAEMSLIDGHARYQITGSGQGGELKGYYVDFKSQTGQVTSTSNGMGKGFTTTGTGRVELNEDGFSYLARLLNNFDYYIVLFATGNTDDNGNPEFYVVGNENGEVTFSNESDTGQERSGDHGHTFTVTCPYQKYPLMKWSGAIADADESDNYQPYDGDSSN